LHGAVLMEEIGTDDWKEDAVEGSSSDTEVPSESHSEVSVGDRDELEQKFGANVAEAAFDGMWSKAYIHRNLLTWFEGTWDAPLSPVVIKVVTTNRFEMTWGPMYCAELRDDGRLHWDDGDVWTRVQPKFEGSWRDATISKNRLTWNEGEEVAIDMLSHSSFRMFYLGKMYTAEVKDNGTLCWDDGDVWRWQERNPNVVRVMPPWLMGCRRKPRNILATTDSPKTSKPTSSTLECVVRDSPMASKARPGAHQDTKSDVLEWNGQALHHAVSSESYGSGSHCQSDVDRTAVFRDNADKGSVRDASAKGVVASTVSLHIHTVNDSAGSRLSDLSVKTQITLTPINGTVYHGEVKSFKGSYGWLVCKALKADYPNCDVMMHKNDCNFRPRWGNRVIFRLALNGYGNPQAVEVLRKDA
jgi:hypothetical protein